MTMEGMENIVQNQKDHINTSKRGRKKEVKINKMYITKTIRSIYNNKRTTLTKQSNNWKDHQIKTRSKMKTKNIRTTRNNSNNDRR